MEFRVLASAKKILAENRLIVVFISVHTLFAIFLGRLFAFAPDEGGYLYTFNNLYGSSDVVNPQYFSGWITAPKIFLWIAYLPAKFINLIGVPDYLSIRLLSIMLAALSLYLLKSILNGSDFGYKISQKVIFLVFFIPSIFLWTSIGLRESFLFVELAAFLAGFNYLIQEKNKRAFSLLILGSYGLLSTKNYLWACLMISVIISCSFFVTRRDSRPIILKFLIASLLVPVIAFASTTSFYALSFIFQSNISGIGQRTSDSVSEIYVDSTGGETGGSPNKQLVTFHGDATLIALHFYLLDNPDSAFSRGLKLFNLDRKVQNLWDEKVQAGLIKKDKQVGKDTSSFNGRILKPGLITNPISMVWPAFVFLYGPFPFIGDTGIAVGISSLESPLWWVFYALVIFQFIRFRKVKFLRDPQILLTLIFLAGEIAFSALVEVNLGTSFRHRSIILVPLVFLYVRLAQRAKEQKDLELGII